MKDYKGRILVVEDERSMREVLRILLEEEMYEVTSAADGEAGIELIKKDIFDLVITDIKMPRADGFEVLKKVKEISPDTIVIMITAFGTTESGIEAMKLGAYDYINKPFKIDEIRLVVKKALEKEKFKRRNHLSEGEGPVNVQPGEYYRQGPEDAGAVQADLPDRSE